jgi:hypothetical protein
VVWCHSGVRNESVDSVRNKFARRAESAFHFSPFAPSLRPVTAAAGDLDRAACADVIREAFEHRLLENLGELNAEGVSELVSHARAVLTSVLMQH